MIADLKPYKKGITKKDIENVLNRGTKYQIIDHKLYRQEDCMFPSRCSGIEYFIKPLLPKLQDMEMIINTRDWPQVSSNYNLGPVFSFSKVSHELSFRTIIFY